MIVIFLHALLLFYPIFLTHLGTNIVRIKYASHNMREQILSNVPDYYFTENDPSLLANINTAPRRFIHTSLESHAAEHFTTGTSISQPGELTASVRNRPLPAIPQIPPSPQST